MPLLPGGVDQRDRLARAVVVDVGDDDARAVLGESTAAARPCPDAAPVISATRPSSSASYTDGA